MRWLCLLLLFITNSIYAGSSVWEVSKGEFKLYIGGTVHVLSKSDYPLPAEFENAYRDSDQLVFETNIKEAQSPEFQMYMMQRMSYPAGKSLGTELSQQAYSSLQAFCQARGIPLANFAQFKPQMISIALVGVELQRMGMVSAGVDDYFYQKAHQDRKPVQYLESVKQQIDFLVGMGEGQENELVLNTIRDLDKIDSMMGDMKDAWRTGNEMKLEKVAVEPMQKEFPELYQDLLVNRNNDWLTYIERMLTTPDVEYVLVGVLHMVGSDGVLQQLRERGYQVRQF